jgi:hypothetical protein
MMEKITRSLETKSTELKSAPNPPGFEPDEEDITSDLLLLPEIAIDYFVKSGKYEQEDSLSSECLKLTFSELPQVLES